MATETSCDCELDVHAPLPDGIVRTNVEPESKTLTIDFDPAVISPATVKEVAQKLGSESEGRFDRCMFRLRGKACEACALHFEKRAEALKGIRRARATFIGGVMTVTFDQALLSESEVMEQVRQTGAPVSEYKVEAPKVGAPGFVGWLRSLETAERMEVICTALTLVLMLGGWLSQRLGWSPVVSNALFVGAYLAGGWFGVQAGLQSLREWTIDVDLLMVLAALGAAVVGAPFEGAMLLFLFSLSNVLQGFAIDRTRQAIHSLMKMRPDKALVRRDGSTLLLPIEQLVVGDILLVRPGESIPLDAQIVEGESSIDEASLTGESIPVFKGIGAPVFAGTINQTGGLEVRVTRLAKDSTIEKLIRMVEEAQTEKAETQRFLDRAEQYYAVGVILFTIGLIFIPHFFMGQGLREAFYRAMTVMVVASPCALIISTPASILSAIGGAARRGVLFKGGAHLERTATVKVIAFDKTGTLTAGKPKVTGLLIDGLEDPPADRANALLSVAAAIELKSEHPLAHAIVTEARNRGLAVIECSDFQSESGKGASGLVGEERIFAGSPRYFEQLGAKWSAELTTGIQKLQDTGKTCVLVGKRSKVESVPEIIGVIAIADVLRPDVPKVIRALREIGIQRIVMLTGDNSRVARAIAAEAGVDEVHADLLPADKVRVVRSLKEIGPVAMIGDGVNDAPALAAANVGVAMGAAGTDVAMETADLVLMSDHLEQIPFAIALSRQARKIIIQNLVFALAVIVLLVISALGYSLPLPVGVIGHEGSTVLVCLNGLRLLGFRWSPA